MGGGAEPKSRPSRLAFHHRQCPHETETFVSKDSCLTEYYRLPTHSGAVFCTSNREGRELAERLSKLGMPAVFQSGRELDITVPLVKVLTLHSAKGLEFPFVAIVGLDEGRLPRINEDLPVEEAQVQEDEQRRLFFVGCSRAMRALLVCGSRAAPSPFLAPLQPPVWRRESSEPEEIPILV